jgi:hypothetical protein
MASKSKASKRSSNPKTTKKARPHEPNAGAGTPPRAHRDDTSEARTQRARLPKTHPNSRGRQAAARKGKGPS